MDVPMLISYGLQGPVGISAGDRLRWQTYNGVSGAENIYMCTVRSMLTKFPGFIFSGLNTIQFYNSALISVPDYL